MQQTEKELLCLVCGFRQEEAPWSIIDKEEYPSFEICLCCGTQFGYHDAIRSVGDVVLTVKRYAKLRDDWVRSGMLYKSFDDPSNPQPNNYNPLEQLKSIDIELTQADVSRIQGGE
jgi:hypothetical protein